MNANQLREAIESLDRFIEKYQYTVGSLRYNDSELHSLTIRLMTDVITETETIAASLRGILAIIESENAPPVDENMVRMHRDGAD